MLPFILAAAALGGGLLAGEGAAKSNKALKKAARQNMDNVDSQINQARSQYYDQQYTLGQRSETNMGNFISSLQGRTGQSYRSAAAQIAQDAALDSSTLKNNLSNFTSAALVQKDQIAASAKGQMKNVGFSAIQGGISAAGQAASLYGGVAGAVSASQAASQAAQAQQVVQSGEPAWLHALNSGMPPSAILSGQYDNAIQDNYDAVNQLRDLGIQSSAAQRDYFSFILDRAQNRRFP